MDRPTGEKDRFRGGRGSFSGNKVWSDAVGEVKKDRGTEAGSTSLTERAPKKERPIPSRLKGSIER